VAAVRIPMESEYRDFWELPYDGQDWHRSNRPRAIADIPAKAREAILDVAIDWNGKPLRKTCGLPIGLRQTTATVLVKCAMGAAPRKIESPPRIRPRQYVCGLPGRPGRLPPHGSR
jgi:hypothetical protein